MRVALPVRVPYGADAFHGWSASIQHDSAHMPRQILVTPKGVLHWAKVVGPAREDKGKPHKPRAWSCEIHYPMGGPEALMLAEKIEELFFNKVGKGVKVSKNGWPFSEVLDENEKPTGMLRFRFRRNETNEERTRQFSPPQVVDSKRNPWDGQLIGNNSVGKVAFTWWTWKDEYNKDGISLNLEGVQVLELVPYGGFNAEDTFPEEEGYEVAQAAAAGGEPGEEGWGNGPASEEEVPF